MGTTTPGSERQKVLRVQVTPEIHGLIMDFAQEQGVSVSQVIYQGLRMVAEDEGNLQMFEAVEREMMRCRRSYVRET